jgi:hypothetical protein
MNIAFASMLELHAFRMKETKLFLEVGIWWVHWD